MRAAFYYGWYPEQWAAAGHRFTPIMGEYDSGDPATIRAHISQMQYAGIDVGIWSWWGQRTPTDERFRMALDIAAEMNFRWCIYYELDYDGRASEWFRVRPDMRYLRDRYFSHLGYYRPYGHPALFVYNPLSSIRGAAKWTRMRKDYNLYVSLADYPEWWKANPVDSWHGYRPAEYGYMVSSGSRIYSVSISAGFWGAGEAEPRLERNYDTWLAAVSLMNEAKPDWQLVYFNEHGEGTAIEPSDARCNEYLCSDYLKPLAL